MRVQVNNARLAFADLFERGSYEGQDVGYGATLLLKKNDPQLAELQAIAKKVHEAKWPGKKVRLARESPFRDGEEKDHLAGFDSSVVFFRANSRQAKPNVFDRDGGKLTQDDGIPYAGCYVDAIIDIYAQDNKFGKAINIGLAAIRFRAHGEAFAGGAPAGADDFEGFEEEGGGGEAAEDDKPWLD